MDDTWSMDAYRIKELIDVLGMSLDNPANPTIVQIFDESDDGILGCEPVNRVTHSDSLNTP